MRGPYVSVIANFVANDTGALKKYPNCLGYFYFVMVGSRSKFTKFVKLERSERTRAAARFWVRAAVRG